MHRRACRSRSPLFTSVQQVMSLNILYKSPEWILGVTINGDLHATAHVDANVSTCSRPLDTLEFWGLVDYLQPLFTWLWEWQSLPNYYEDPSVCEREPDWKEILSIRLSNEDALHNLECTKIYFSACLYFKESLKAAIKLLEGPAACAIIIMHILQNLALIIVQYRRIFFFQQDFTRCKLLENLIHCESLIYWKSKSFMIFHSICINRKATRGLRS